MHEYDITLKLLLRESAGLAIRELTGGVTRWLNAELPELQNTRVDLLGETADGSLVHIELQSRNDGKMALRMAEYCLRVYRLFGKIPRQMVLYVGNEALRMEAALPGSPDLSFRYKLIDSRELDGERLLGSLQVGDNVIAILGRLGNRPDAVREILGKLPGLEPDSREFYLRALLILSGLRGLEEVVEEEARKVPVLNDILDHKVLGREFKRGVEQGVAQGMQRGEAAMLHRLIEERFGPIPAWAEEQIATRSTVELEELGVRLLKAQSLDALLK
jgi:Domain of unknown function (DUF4351)